MSEWTRVKWTEARQILAILDWPAGYPDGDPSSRPKAFFDSLRSQRRLPEAASYLGQALPRFEAVAWAARSVQNVRETAPHQNVRGAEADALKAALLWLQDPSENRRRAAYDAAEKCRSDAPERMAALAAFFSGGSIAPPDCPPVQAQRDAAGRFAAGAVLAAAASTPELMGVLSSCLDTGDAIAAGQLDTGA